MIRRRFKGYILVYAFGTLQINLNSLWVLKILKALGTFLGQFIGIVLCSMNMFVTVAIRALLVDSAVRVTPSPDSEKSQNTESIFKNELRKKAILIFFFIELFFDPTIFLIWHSDSETREYAIYFGILRIHCIFQQPKMSQECSVERSHERSQEHFTLIVLQERSYERSTERSQEYSSTCPSFFFRHHIPIFTFSIFWATCTFLFFPGFLLPPPPDFWATGTF